MAIVKVTPELIAEAIAATDWQALDALTDDDIARAVAEDPDAAPLLTDGEAAAMLVRTVRKRLKLTQLTFAGRYYLPTVMLRNWEQNRRRPDAAAMAYLRVIAREPEIVARALVGK